MERGSQHTTATAPTTVEEANECPEKLLQAPATEPSTDNVPQHLAKSAEDPAGETGAEKGLDVPQAVGRQDSSSSLRSVEEMVVPPAEDLHR